MRFTAIPTHSLTLVFCLALFFAAPAQAQGTGTCCGKVGVGTTTISDGSGSGGQSLFLDVAGAAGATHYCDENGLNCFTASSLSGGVADDILDFTKFLDAMALDASTSITADNAEVLSVVNTGTGNSFRVDDVASDTTPFVVDAAGNVGIGTSAPGYNLDIGDFSSNASLRLAATSSSGTAQIRIMEAGDTTGFSLNFATADNVMSVRRHDGSSPGVAVMSFLKQSDNVGIGTTAPTGKLSIKTDAIGVTQSDANGLYLENTTAATAGAMQWSPGIVLAGSGWKTNATAGARAVKWRIDNQPISASSETESKLNFATSVNGAAYADSGTYLYLDRFGVTKLYTTSLNAGSITGVQTLTVDRLNSGNPSDIFTVASYGPAAATSGTFNSILNSAGAAPTSGTLVYNAYSYTGTINQTGGANGITRGIYLNPTLTAAADWRSLEIANNSGFGVYQSGASATNYFAGNVGIGTTAPLGKLYVTSGLGLTPNANWEEIVAVGSSGNNAGISILTSNNVLGGLMFGDPESATVGRITYSHVSDYMAFDTNNSERMRIGSTGNVGIGTSSPTSFGGFQTLLDISGASVSLVLHDTNDEDFELSANGGIFRVSGSVTGSVLAASGGNIGIGTTSPAAKLDIADTALAGSGSLAGSALNIAQTWNTTGTPTAVKVNVTDTASNAASLLMDLQVGGSSKFNISKAGVATASSGMSALYFSASPSSSVGWAGRSYMLSPADGVIELTNNAITDFNRLQFGGKTSSFPAIKRNGIGLDVRLADDSADAPITASNVISTGVVRLKGYTVATLPAGTQGDTAFVTDALAPTFLANVVGGGAVVTPVFYDGTNWVVH